VFLALLFLACLLALVTSPLLLVRSLSLSPSLAVEFCVFSSSPLLKLFGSSSCVSCGGYYYRDFSTFFSVRFWFGFG
jgi:hypothetical protein